MIDSTIIRAHRHETIAFHELMRTGAIRRQAKGRPKNKLRRLAGDKAYSSEEIRGYLRSSHIRITIPRRVNETGTRKFDKDIYRLRNYFERSIGRMKYFRPLAARHEKFASSHRTLWVIVHQFTISLIKPVFKIIDRGWKYGEMPATLQ